jgi:hypothetical protein
MPELAPVTRATCCCNEICIAHPPFYESPFC